MATLNKPLVLLITSDEQLASLRRALEMQCCMEDDILLDDTVTSIAEVRNLAVLDDTELRSKLADRRRAANIAIDRMLTTRELQSNFNTMLKVDDIIRIEPFK